MNKKKNMKTYSIEIQTTKLIIEETKHFEPITKKNSSKITILRFLNALVCNIANHK